MLKKFICLLGLSLLILSTSICFAESQSPDKILNQIYLGQPLEEIQQNFSLELKKHDDKKKITTYEAFINPLEGYDVSIDQPITLEFYNGKLAAVSIYGKMGTPKNRLEHHNKLNKIIQNVWGEPIHSETNRDDGEGKINTWIPKGENLMFITAYIDLSKLPGNKTAISSITIQFLSKNKEPKLQ